MKFAVVVVFHNPAAIFSRPVYELQTTFQGHGGPGGVLVRGRHVNAVRAAAIFKGFAGAEVARIFNQNRFASIDQ